MHNSITFTKNHRTIHLQWVIFMVCKLTFKKAVNELYTQGIGRGCASERPWGLSFMNSQETCLSGRDRAIAGKPEAMRPGFRPPVSVRASYWPALPRRRGHGVLCHTKTRRSRAGNRSESRQANDRPVGQSPAVVPPHLTAKTTQTNSSLLVLTDVLRGNTEKTHVSK